MASWENDESLSLDERIERRVAERMAEDEVTRRKMLDEYEEDRRKRLKEDWELEKALTRDLRERLRRDPWDDEAWENDRWIRMQFGDLYTAEFRGEEDPPRPPARRAFGQEVEHKREEVKKEPEAYHGLADVHTPPLLHQRSDVAWDDDAIWPRDDDHIWPRDDQYHLSPLHQSLSPWSSSFDTGSPAVNGLLLIGALALIVYYRRGARTVLTTSAQLLYVMPWLVTVMASEAVRLLAGPIFFVVSYAVGLLYWVLRDYIVLPTAGWFERTFSRTVYGVAAAVVVSWVVYATLVVLQWVLPVYLVSFVTLMGGGWALQAYVLGPLARPRVYWIAVAIWAAYGAMWLEDLRWYSFPTSPYSETPPLSFMEMEELDPGLSLGHVVVRAVRDALGTHVDERLFAFFDADQWEKRFMDWFVDRGYVLRPCQYLGCMIPDEEWLPTSAYSRNDDLPVVYL
ncbi:hypothetical protein PG988_004329 [Apiospora saccharicola]